MKIRNSEQFLIVSQIADISQKKYGICENSSGTNKNCKTQSDSENDFIVVYLTQT
jgi:hypothetical protein